jgi:preprotein translocase subunit SecA
VSDIRALIAHRHLIIADGVYAERLTEPVHKLEAWLRFWVAWARSGRANRKDAFVSAVDAWGKRLVDADDEAVRRCLEQAAAQMRRDGLCDEALVPAFAAIREASGRCLGKRHHDVQLLAGRVLLRGQIAEMATGEGKTLAGTLAVCAAAAAGALVHVVTVNDYLAERDAEENEPLFGFFGFSVGTVKQDMSIPDRQAVYHSHVVYVSNKELTFDYLKDRIGFGSKLEVQSKLARVGGVGSGASPILGGLHVAIVDEADSVLIDEARTPLIISESMPDDLGEEVYQRALDMALELTPERHFRFGHGRDVWLTEAGEAHVGDLLHGSEGIWRSPLWQRELINKALSALHGFRRDEHYIVAEDKVQIVDEFTGRVMPDRTWERGLHQMIECKEGCEITGQRKTLSQTTYQRFFGRYVLLCGMTGTAKEIRAELRQVYDLRVLRIPTFKTSRRVHGPTRVFRQSAERWDAVAARAATLSADGRAVLIGTRSVDASEALSKRLDALGVRHKVLNAKQDKDEAASVAAAGDIGAITVATNMAGRGTDIRLDPVVESKGGLHVILTEFHESARVDRQLFGRSARQGNPGSVEAMVSLEDELFKQYAAFAATRLSLLWLGQSRFCQLCFSLFVAVVQGRAERRNRRIRLDTIARDQKWQRSLGFVGGHKK